MKYSNKILLTDMDGTLLNSESKVSTINMKAIHDFVTNGGRFGIASGRGLENALTFLDGVPLNYYSIFQNGSVLYDMVNNKVEKSFSLEKESLIPLLNICLSEYPSIGIQIHTSNTGYFVSSKDHTDKIVVEDHEPYGFIDFNKITHKDWTKILFNGNPNELKWLENYMSRFNQKNIVDCVYSSEIYYELLPYGSNKGNMIKHLKQISSKDDIIYTVGNYYNDVEMIKLADVGIFTKNTPNDIIGLADIVCKHCDDHAIADVIYNIIS